MVNPPTETDIRALVEAEDDFAHELRVGRIIRSAYQANNLSVEHGGTYTDPVTKYSRQFDYRVKFEAFESNAVIQLAIECKNLNPVTPMLVSGGLRAPAEAFHHVLHHGTDLVVPIAQVETCESLYRRDEFAGKTVLRMKLVIEGKRDKKVERRELIGDGDIYDKWDQALSSAFDLAQWACLNPGKATAVLPVVVVPDNTMWMIDYTDDAKIREAKVVNEVRYYVGKDLQLDSKLSSRVRFTLSHVHFLTMTGFQNFLERITDRKRDLEKVVPSRFQKPRFGR